jgi:hypothetical protein
VLARELQLHDQRRQGVEAAAREQRVVLGGDAGRIARRRRDADAAVVAGALDVAQHALAADEVEARGAVLGQEGVEIDDVADPRRKAVGDTGDHHAAVGMADQDEVAERLALDGAADVLDVGGEVDVAAEQMAPLAEAGERGRVDPVSGAAERLGDRRPGHAAAPGAVHDHVGLGHRASFHATLARMSWVRPGISTIMTWPQAITSVCHFGSAFTRS